MFAVKYSFNFRYQRHLPREIIVPLEKLAGINLLDGDLNWQIRKLIDDDWALLYDLLGDDVREYEDMKSSQLDYSKDLERERERAEILMVNA